ncbi:MAG: triose-phosphate isomerase [Acidobacteria bacterium]|nr:triose-phosphate isomerase [Acidobacteriota bacterium]
MRKPLMAGNWKLFKTAAETKDYFTRFLPMVAGSRHCEIAICPPFVNIPAAVEAAAGSNVGIGGQNVFWENQGAFTGEVSGPMLKACGAVWAIIGHSERRQYFGETDETVQRRTVAAIAAGLRPIVCVGEKLEERESGRTEAVLADQVAGGLAGLSAAGFAQVVIAYEPVWAIGTGKTATPEMAADAHRFIRGRVAGHFGAAAAAAVRILYGGSVKPDNVKGLMAQPEIDGALVGGASLDPAGFASIVNF